MYENICQEALISLPATLYVDGGGGPQYWLTQCLKSSQTLISRW